MCKFFGLETRGDWLGFVCMIGLMGLFVLYWAGTPA